MSNKFQVKVVLAITKDGVPFAATEQSYHNMDKSHVHALETAVANALLALGLDPLADKS